MGLSNQLVSVIINCKNSEKYINECINSVLTQTYSNYEIVLINNFSTDRTKEIILSYSDNRIQYFETKSPLNLGAARNIGLKISKGEYIAFLDSDDTWYPNKLELILKKFTENVGLVYSDVKYFNNKNSFNLYDIRNLYKGNCFKELLDDYNLCMSSCVISKKAILNQKILFDEELKVCEDLDFFLKIAYVFKIEYVRDVLVEYRIHGKNLTFKYPELFFDEFEKTISNLLEMFQINNNIIIKALDKNLINRSKHFWRKNRRIKAYKTLIKVKKLYLKALFYAIIIVFPFKIINFIYRSVSSKKIEFN
tara:strand:- start:67 stop:990 length:924 start_codon:yes stop_codon:yes gene_type:complete